MVPKMAEKIKPIPMLLLSGVIWGLWHAPLTALGHNYGVGYAGFPFTGILAMCGFCIVLGIFLSFVTLKTGSCIPAVLGHGAVNSIVGIGIYFTTNGGNPFVGAAVDKVLEMMERDRITDHVQEVGAYLSEKLEELVAKYDCLTAHRGVGLIQGVVCTKKVGEISAKALEHGLILITAGSDVLRFVPPLVIEKSHVDEMIEKLSACLDELS